MVEGVLGDGGMGTVVVARHLELDEHVAIKLLRDELAGNELVVSRFLREGKIAARIRSTEHIVKVRDIGRLENGVPFMVMELLEGEDLETRLDREQRLPTQLAVDLTLQACDALAAAHEAGIVHRDIKPGNLFLTEKRGSPSVKILDFGISKLEGDLVEKGHRTSAQDIFGSPFYMSPEQLLSSAEVDTRADIWSLGVVLYEMITGNLPFEADVLAKLHIAVLQGEPLDVRTHGIEVSDELAGVVHGCLQRSRNDRFQTMRELAEALAPFASSMGLAALDDLRNAPARPAPASISAEWAAYTDGRSLTPPSVQSIPAPRLSQRSIPTYHSEPKLPMVGREVPKETVSGKTLTPWANNSEDKRARRKQVGIVSGIAAMVVLGGSAWLALRPSPQAPPTAALPNGEPPAPAANALPRPAHDNDATAADTAAPVAAHFEILEAQVDAGALSARGDTSRHRKKADASAPDKPAPVPATKPSTTKLPDDRN